MNLSQLPKLTDRSKKRIGRGIGSGRGKTSGRGTKGQKARGKVPAAAVGGGLILYKKLPFRRGLGNRKASPKPATVTLSQLNVFKARMVVDVDALVKQGLVRENVAEKRGVKVLSAGELKVALEIKLPVSESARVKIEKAGGSVA